MHGAKQKHIPYFHLKSEATRCVFYLTFSKPLFQKRLNYYMSFLVIRDIILLAQLLQKAVIDKASEQRFYLSTYRTNVPQDNSNIRPASCPRYRKDLQI